MIDKLGRFMKGNTPWSKLHPELMKAWNKGTKGVMKPNSGSFKKGQHPSPKTEFKKGHPPTKGCFKKGEHLRENNFQYKGGKTKHQLGYLLILQPEHPFCNKKGYVRRSHLVIEKYLGRYLKNGETAHHRNKIKTDDRVKNLMAFVSNSAHMKFHHNPDNVKPEEIIFDGRNYYPTG